MPIMECLKILNKYNIYVFKIKIDTIFFNIWYNYYMIKTTIEEKIKSLKQTNSMDMVSDFQPFEKDHFLYHQIRKSFYHNMAMIELIALNKEALQTTSINILLSDSKDGNISLIIEEPDPMGFSDEDNKISTKVNQSKIEKMKWITKKTPAIFKKLEKIYLVSDNFNFNDYCDSATKYYENLLIIKDSIKGLTNKEVFSLIDRDDLKKVFYNIRNQDINGTASILDFIQKKNDEKIYDFAEYFVERKAVSKLRKIMTTHDNKSYVGKKINTLLKEVVRIGITTKEFKESFAKKIKKYKTEVEIEEGLKKYTRSLSGWEMKNWQKKILSPNINVVANIIDDIMVLEVLDYDTMKELGSTQWCIATDKSYFDEYTGGYNKQYMICDFSRESEDPLSMIGATIDFYGNIYVAHNKNDDKLPVDEIDVLKPDFLEQFFTKHNVVEFEKRMISMLPNELYGKEDDQIFKEMSFYGYTENSKYLKSKERIINNYKKYIVKFTNFNQDKLCDVIMRNLIKRDTPGKFGFNKNIDEIVDVLKRTFEYTPIINEITKENINFALRNDENLTLFSSLVDNDQSSNINHLSLLNHHNGANSYEIIKSAFEHDEIIITQGIETRIDDWMPCGELIFKSKELVDFLKDKDVFKKILVNTVQKLDDVFLHGSIHKSIMPLVFKTIKELTTGKRSELLKGVMFENVCGITDLSILVDNKVITQKEAETAVKNMEDYRDEYDGDIMYHPSEKILSSASFYKLIKVVKDTSDDFKDSDCINKMYTVAKVKSKVVEFKKLKPSP